MKIQEVIIMMGLPGSGKTTFSKQWVHDHPEYKRINRDDLRLMIYHGEWSNKKERAVLIARKTLILSLLSAGYSLILDDTNLVPRRMQETKDIIKEWEKITGIPVKITVKSLLDVPLEICIARDAQRPPLTKVGDEFIRDYYNKYVKKI